MVIDNYSGNIGNQYNPANLADSRFKFNMNVVGFDFHLQNNYLQLEPGHSIYKFLYWKWDSTFGTQNFDYPFKEYYVKERLNGLDKYIYTNSKINALSMQFGLPDKSGISLSFSTRISGSVSNLAEDGIKTFLQDLDTGGLYKENQQRLLGQSVTIPKASASGLVYQQTSLKYAKVLKAKRKDFFKMGVGVDYNVGLFGAYYKGNNSTYTLTGIDTLEVSTSEMEIAYLGEDYYTDQSRRLNDFFGKSKLGKGVGINFGLVYEHRPNIKDYYYKMDNRKQEDRSENKYAWKLSGSIVDLGFVTFNMPGVVRRIAVPEQTDTLVWADFDDADQWKGTDELDTFITTFFNDVDTSSKFTIYTPASINLAGDYKVRDNFYLSAAYSQRLTFNKGRGVKMPNVLTVAPRYESKWYTFSMPISISRYYNLINVGAYARVGVFYIGTDNLGGVFTGKKTNGFNIYTGFNWPIHYSRLKDKDGDGFSDGYDKCPDFAGVKSTKGCPDGDGDKVPDDEDKCPNEAGSKRTKGCPDPDDDGVAGADDLCPDVYGDKNSNGCPDSDGDGIHDGKDKCPNQAGEIKYNGCPDAGSEINSTSNKGNKTGGIDISKFDNWDFSNYEYWPVLGAYNDIRWAEELQSRLEDKIGIITTIKLIPGVSAYYITMGKAKTKVDAIEIQKVLIALNVNDELNGSVWWKKVKK